MSHTAGKWIVEGSTVYQLMHDGWRKGKEQFRNKYYFRVEADFEAEQNENAIAHRLVACWNEHDDLIKERDELVKLLRFLMYEAPELRISDHENWRKQLDEVLTILSKYPEQS